MGSWNGTCAVSNLHIYSGQEVAVFMLLKNRAESEMCYVDSLYSLCHIPFYGKNDSYGSVEDCHGIGIGLDLVLSAIKDDLYEMEVGANEYHDIAVKKDNFNEQLLFEADHEGRLGIKTDKKYYPHQLEMLAHYQEKEKKGQLTEEDKVSQSRVQEKIDKELNQFQRVTHIQVHGKVFADILENFAMNYVDEDNGYKTKKRYFSEVVADIPEYIATIKKQKKSDRSFYSLPTVKSNHVSEMLRFYPAYSELALIQPVKLLFKYIDENESEEKMMALIKAFIEGLWFKNFMSMSRKVLVPQCGAGSQNDDHKAYKVLTDSIRGVLKEEKKERRENEKMYG